jgi:hypothetical protein
MLEIEVKVWISPNLDCVPKGLLWGLELVWLNTWSGCLLELAGIIGFDAIEDGTVSGPQNSD